jgi:putative Holliday junction resolvase
MREGVLAARAQSCRFRHSSSAVSMAERLLMAFDFGTRRVGVAVGNSITCAARPLAIIDAQGDDRWHRIEALLAEWRPHELVVGIPRHPDGAAHEMTARCERFARQLEGRFGLPVARVDERYSSTAVAGGRDDAAAAVILQQYLSASGQPAPAGPEPDAPGQDATP